MATLNSNLVQYTYYVNEICEAFGKAHFGAYPARWRHVMVGLMTMDYTAQSPRYQYKLQEAAVKEVETLLERVKANSEACRSLALAAIRYMVKHQAKGTNTKHFKQAAFNWLGLIKMRDHYMRPSHA
ncbi:hypothetical protein JCM11641_004303 [Rhodosporidiobolus odoratus]